MVIEIRLKELMKKKGWSYRETAQQVFGDTSLAPTIHRIANGQTSPGLDTLDKLCTGLGCKLEELLVRKKK